GHGDTNLPRRARWKGSHAVPSVPRADPRPSRTVGWSAKEGRNLQPASWRSVEGMRLRPQAGEGGFCNAAA
ncbi:hypothetical protein, partial [Mesorhizobium sp. GbtcB19]|uniref:hypothetical protein n=1 Tax=Mesorhizobium sp. GbtcB19 TaxID=2824764 RepID=UPI001C2FB117